MRKFATTLFIGLLSSVSASAISHFSQRVLYKPPQHTEKIAPPLYLLRPQNRLFNSNQASS
jgi:hypothetical protein